LKGDLLIKIHHRSQADSTNQLSNQFERFPDVESTEQASLCPEMLTDGFGLHETGLMLTKLLLIDFEGPLPITNTSCWSLGTPNDD
jgi:hypothetical protein